MAVRVRLKIWLKVVCVALLPLIALFFTPFVYLGPYSRDRFTLVEVTSKDDGTKVLIGALSMIITFFIDVKLDYYHVVRIMLITD